MIPKVNKSNSKNEKNENTKFRTFGRHDFAFFVASYVIQQRIIKDFLEGNIRNCT